MIQSFINTAHYIMLEGRGTTLRAAGVFQNSQSLLDAPPVCSLDFL